MTTAKRVSCGRKVQMEGGAKPSRDVAEDILIGESSEGSAN